MRYTPRKNKKHLLTGAPAARDATAHTATPVQPLSTNQIWNPPGIVDRAALLFASNSQKIHTFTCIACHRNTPMRFNAATKRKLHKPVSWLENSYDIRPENCQHCTNTCPNCYQLLVGTIHYNRNAWHPCRPTKSYDYWECKAHPLNPHPYPDC